MKLYDVTYDDLAPVWIDEDDDKDKKNRPTEIDLDAIREEIDDER